MAEPQNHNYNDLIDRHYSVLERLEAFEVKNRMLKEEIALMEAAKHRHYLLIGLLFYILVPVPIFSGAIYICGTIDDPWFSAFSTVYYHLLLNFVFYFFVMDWVETSGQAMCEPLRELLEMAEAQEAVHRELRQEEGAIRRAQECRRFQERIRQQLREMAGRGRDAEDEDVAHCTICLDQFNVYEDGEVAIFTCKHIFHRACIELWLPHKNTCPVCRTKIDSYRYYWWRFSHCR